jgi:hypothetical protein
MDAMLLREMLKNIPSANFLSFVRWIRNTMTEKKEISHIRRVHARSVDRAASPLFAVTFSIVQRGGGILD